MPKQTRSKASHFNEKKKSAQEIQEEIYDMEKERYDISKKSILSEIRIDIKCKTENQKKFLKLIEENDLTICLGEAGCGKTFLMCYAALRLLKTNPSYKKILLIKSITELKGESLGSLPGSKDEKILFYMMSYLDSFFKLIGESKTKQLIEDGTIVFEPIAYIRGRNFENSIVCLDETQNVSRDNLKSILSRLSENSKYIVSGDIEQIDLKNKSESSLEFLYKKAIENPIDGVGAIKFEQKDIVRHRLTSYFLNLFK